MASKHARTGSVRPWPPRHVFDIARRVAEAERESRDLAKHPQRAGQIKAFIKEIVSADDKERGEETLLFMINIITFVT